MWNRMVFCEFFEQCSDVEDGVKTLHVHLKNN
jgi:hypothetical protein